MKKTILFLLLSLPIIGSAQNFSRKQFVQPLHNIFRITATEDKGFALAGREYNITYLLKYDSLFNYKWGSYYSTDSTVFIISYSFETSDHGFMLIGSIRENIPNAQQGDIAAVKIDSLGAVQSAHSMGILVGPTAAEVIFGARKTSDGNYILVTQTPFNVMKISASGNMLWDLNISNGSTVFGEDIVEGPDGLYYALAYTLTGSLIVKIDSAGVIRNAVEAVTSTRIIKLLVYNDKIIGALDGGLGMYGMAMMDTSLSMLNVYYYQDSTSHCGITHTDMRKMSNGTIVALINRTDPSGDPSNSSVITYDSLLNILNFSVLDSVHPHYTRNIVETGNNNAVLFTVASDTISTTYEFIAIDSLGRNSCFSYDVSPIGRSLLSYQSTPVTLTSNLVGNNHSLNMFETFANFNVSDGCVTTGVSDFDESPLSVFPNPADNYFVVRLPDNKEGEIYLYDNCGRFILKQNCRERINVERLDEGIYFYECVSVGGMVFHGKILIQR